MSQPRPVLVVDFGAQYAQLIARRVREARRLLRDRALHDAGRRDAGEGSRGRHPLRRPGSVYADGRPAGRPALFEAGVPVLRHLLRLPGDGAGARRRGGPHRPVGVRRAPRCASTDPGLLFAGLPADQLGVDVARRLRWPARRGLPGHRVTAGAPVAAFEDSRRRCAGVQFHPEVLHTQHGQAMLEQLPARHRRHAPPTWTTAVVDRRAGGGDPRAGRRPAGDLRALRRGRLRGRRGARAPRRSATSSPACSSTTGCCARASAEQVERDYVAATGIRLKVVDARGPVPRRARRGHRPRGEAQDHRPAVHPGVRGRRPRGGGRGRRARRDGRASSSRARSTRTSSSPAAAPAPPTSRATTTSAACPTTCSSPWSSRCARCSRTRCARSASSSGCRRRWCGATRSRARAWRSASSAR